MTVISSPGLVSVTRAFVARSAVYTVFDAASVSSRSGRLVREHRRQVAFTMLQLGTRRPAQKPSARERWQHITDLARERLATAPVYPDDPRDSAEQEEVTRVLMDSQGRSISDL